MNLPTPQQDEVRSVRIAVMAAMETGNMQKARTTLREFAAVQPDAARDLRMDVVKAYGTDIG